MSPHVKLLFLCDVRPSLFSMNVKVIQDSRLRTLSLPSLKGLVCDQSDLPFSVWIEVSWSCLGHCFFGVRFPITAHISPVVTEAFRLLNFHLIQIYVCKMYGFVYKAFTVYSPESLGWLCLDCVYLTWCRDLFGFSPRNNHLPLSSSLHSLLGQ